ncbi:MAG: nicotinate-nucleotide adenylyltransferase [Melioribacteraceae bacterium]|nr:nicotinate-nucleotide adenylyltransferase [Melioribacteraceae bacterium]
MKQNKIAIFGGTFDPVHNGHLITCQSVLEERKLDKVVFIPTHISPLKQNYKPTPDIHRLEMLKLAIDSNPNFTVSDIELKRENVSYTIDTILELKNKYSEIELIIGYDNLLLFEKWREPDRIVSEVKLLVMKRISEVKEERNRYFDKSIFLDNPIIEISSSQIRERIKNNLPVDYLLPDSVHKYIIQQKLYR